MKRIKSLVFAAFFMLLIPNLQAQNCSISGAKSVLLGKTITLTVPAEAGVSQYWSEIGSEIVLISPSSNNTIEIKGVKVGTGRLCVAKYGSGKVPCTSCVYITVSPYCLPDCPRFKDARFTQRCKGSSITLTASYYNSANTYTWVSSRFGKFDEGKIANWYNSNSGGMFDSEIITLEVSRDGCESQFFEDKLITCNHNCGPNGAEGDQLEKSKTSIFPNPTTGESKVQIDAKENSKYTIEVMDLSGKKVLSVRNKTSLPTGNNQIAIDSDQLKSGTYLINVYQDNSLVKSHKLIKK